MGLSADQARVLLLTAKNDAYELQAQLISNERLILAQEQERISNEYSDATSNEIYVCDVTDPDKEKGTSEQVMTFGTLAAANAGQRIYIKLGDKYIGAQVDLDENGKPKYENGLPKVTYYDEAGKKIDKDTGIYQKSAEYNSIIQSMARNNTLEIYIAAPEDTNTAEETQTTHQLLDSNGDKRQYVRKSPSSLATVRTRYYTEDDAAAEAAYNAAMAKVNAIDKKLENELNQIETAKKAVETELESAKNLVKTNEERTFKYMS